MKTNIKDMNTKLIQAGRLGLMLLATTFMLSSCNDDGNTSDAFGNFDVDETVISAESPGELLTFSVQEGQTLKPGQVVGSIDSTDILLSRAEIMANRQSVTAKLTSINAEIRVLNTQLEVIEKEHKRVLKLLESDAATEKQKDDIEGNIAVIKSKIAAANAQKPAVQAQLDVIESNVAKINNQLSKCIIVNPVEGRVLTKLAEPHELVAPGKPLYKIADTNNVYLKAYVTGTQVSGLKVGQAVSVLLDQPEGGLRTLKGTIQWVSDQAEFTPKMIQTREERVSLVYAIKVAVANDGTIKIGMPGEVKFGE